jgi:transposase InsO family protein
VSDPPSHATIATLPEQLRRSTVSTNALAEAVIGLFKTEVIRRLGPWRSRAAVEIATLEWVDWFTILRLLEPIGHIPPAEAEDRYYAELATRHAEA